MTSGAPFIGSKISLISRAEIRYEGILYQVDTKESTVTLAKVRSFGTESRPSSKHIPPRSEVYEFIIFRASDIKDLNVSEMPAEEPNSPPQDPAILSAQSTAPAPIPPSTITPAPVGSSHPHPQPSHPPHHSVAHGAPPPYFSHPPMPPPGSYTPFGMPYYRPPPIMMGAGGPHPIPQGMPPQPHPHTTQGAHPTSVVPPHVSVIGAPPAQSHTPPRSIPNTITPSPGLMATPTYAPAGIEAQPQASSTPVVSLAESTQVNSEHVVPATAPSGNVNLAPETSEPHSSSQLQEPGQKDTTQKERREQGNFTEKRRQQGQAKSDRGRGYNSSYRGSRGYRGRREYRGDGGPRGGGRGGGGYRSQQQGSRGGGYRQQGTAAKQTPFKYDTDFDFESANAKLSKETLEKEFKEKLRVDSTSRKSSESYGEGEEVTAGSDDEVVIVEEEGGVVEEVEEYYDKSKSFFDNISCEASSAKQRYSRNEEREVNMQTFGVSGFNRGYGYRNRRGGRWRGRGGYRGGRNRYGGGWSNEGGGRGGYSREGGRGGYTRGYRDQHHSTHPPANEDREA